MWPGVKEVALTKDGELILWVSCNPFSIQPSPVSAMVTRNAS